MSDGSDELGSIREKLGVLSTLPEAIKAMESRVRRSVDAVEQRLSEVIAQRTEDREADNRRESSRAEVVATHKRSLDRLFAADTEQRLQSKAMWEKMEQQNKQHEEALRQQAEAFRAAMEEQRVAALKQAEAVAAALKAQADACRATMTEHTGQLSEMLSAQAGMLNTHATALENHRTVEHTMSVTHANVLMLLWTHKLAIFKAAVRGAARIILLLLIIAVPTARAWLPYAQKILGLP